MYASRPFCPLNHHAPSLLILLCFVWNSRAWVWCVQVDDQMQKLSQMVVSSLDRAKVRTGASYCCITPCTVY